MVKGLGDAIKQLAIGAVDSHGTVDVRYGTVISTMPLRVQITPDYILPADVLMVPDKLRPHEIETSDVTGNLEEVTWLVYEGLAVGDGVALIRESGGGKYYILDRYRSAITDDDDGVMPDD